MPSFVLVLTPDAAAERGALVATAALVMACLAGIAWTTRAEVRRRRSSHRSSTRMHDVLADFGHSLLFGSPIVLACAVLAVAEQGAALAPGLLAGGAAALTYSLVLPARLAAAKRGADHDDHGGHAQRLFETIARLRKPWLPVIACAPFFAGVALYLSVAGHASPEPTPRTFLAGALFGLLHVGTLAWGIQCVQVRRTLLRQADAHRGR